VLNIYHLNSNENFCIVHDPLKLFQCADCFNPRLCKSLYCPNLRLFKSWDYLNSTSRWVLNQGTWSILSTAFEERKKHLYSLLEETTIHFSGLPKFLIVLSKDDCYICYQVQSKYLLSNHHSHPGTILDVASFSA